MECCGVGTRAGGSHLRSVRAETAAATDASAVHVAIAGRLAAVGLNLS